MSIVSVHGPNMWGGTGAGGAGTGETVETAQVVATADMTNGLTFTFEAKDKTRPAADYDWTYTPAGGTPVSPINNTHGPHTIVFTGSGTKTVTLTVAAGAGPPAGGAYPITVEALTAGPRSLLAGEDEEPELEVETPVEEYNPGDYTVTEVVEYAQGLDDDGIRDLIAAEEAGRGRSTLVSQLNALLPYNPGDHTVAEVVDYAESHPDEVNDIIVAEEGDKNRSTLLNQLYALRDAE